MASTELRFVFVSTYISPKSCKNGSSIGRRIVGSINLSSRSFNTFLVSSNTFQVIKALVAHDYEAVYYEGGVALFSL